MKALAFTTLLAGSALAAPLVEAPVVLLARHPSGAVFELHDIEGPCQSPARLATYTGFDGVYKVQGCFKLNEDGTLIGISWFDGDASTLPFRVFKPVETL